MSTRSSESGITASQASLGSDAELLDLLHDDPEAGWRVFIDRYADLIYSLIRHLGFDYDQAMDRFVFVCEKLSEHDFRRLKAIRYAGDRGELTPWIRQVVKRLCINWAWSEDGRKRLLKPIAQLGELEQRVFELYFWQGLLPAEIDERLRQEHYSDVEPFSVFSALETILSSLSEKKIWRLISNLARTRGSLSLDHLDAESERSWEIPTNESNPENKLIHQEQDRILQAALRHLPERQVLLLQFRFEQGLSIREISEIMRIEEREVRKLIDSGLAQLRKMMKSEQ